MVNLINTLHFIDMKHGTKNSITFHLSN